MPSYRSLRNLGFGVAAAIPLSLAASQHAHAVPYGYASNVDANFGITAVAGGTYTALQNTAVFTTNNSITSTYFATPASTLVSTSGNVVSDAAQVKVPGGPSPIENFFGQAYAGAGVNSLRADSLDSAFGGSGGNVAEGKLVTGPVGGAASGFGKLDSTNTSTITVTIGAPGTSLQITFQDTPGLEASTGALLGEKSTATIASSVSITNAAGDTVFTFVPTGHAAGDVGGTVGGTASSDPFSLNRTLASTAGVPADNTFFPGLGTFTATTGPLAAGNYNIVIGQSATIAERIGQPVQTPEPASLALLGAGLIGLGVARRKRKAS